MKEYSKDKPHEDIGKRNTELTKLQHMGRV